MQVPAVGNFRVFEEHRYARGGGTSLFPHLWKGLIFASPSQIANPSTVKDLSKNHIDGVGTDLAVLGDKGYFFDGSTSNITLGDDTSFNLGSFTFACRIRTLIGTSIQRLLYKGNNSSIEPVSVFLYNGRPVMEYYNAPTDYYTDLAASPITDGVWHTCCFVRDAGVNMFIFIDGVFHSDTTGGGADGGQTTTTTGNLRLGMRNNGDGQYEGAMRDIFLWNRALTRKEAQMVSSGGFPTRVVRPYTIGKAFAAPAGQSVGRVYFHSLFGPKIVFPG